MSSATKQLQASARAQGGKGAARAVRRAGRIPAVIYGGGEAPQPISLDYNQAQKLIFAGHFLTTLFEIDLDGHKIRVIPRDYQMDPVKDLPMHIDFLRLKAGQKIRATRSTWSMKAGLIRPPRSAGSRPSRYAPC